MADVNELWAVVRAIPVGRVMSYGEVGRLLSRHASGRIVGQWMARCPEDVPWWRVVAKDGGFPIEKRGPGMGLEQSALLREEGVELDDSNRVPRRYFVSSE